MGERTMLFNGAVHDAFFADSLVNGRKELGLLIAVMLRDTVMPSKTIAYKICAVGWLDAGSLLVDTVEATDEGVVAQGHVGCFNGKWIRLGQ